METVILIRESGNNIPILDRNYNYYGMFTGCTGGRGEWLEHQHRYGSFSRGSADSPVQGQCPAC